MRTFAASGLQIKCQTMVVLVLQVLALTITESSRSPATETQLQRLGAPQVKGPITCPMSTHQLDSAWL